MQIEELFEFVYILIEKKKVTAREMSERFGVSTRTVYRWLEALSISGIPVYSLKGRGGGIAISEKYALDNRILSDEEKLAILSSVKALDSLSGSQNQAVNINSRAAEKLSGFVSGDADWLYENSFARVRAGKSPDSCKKCSETLRRVIKKSKFPKYDMLVSYFLCYDFDMEKRPAFEEFSKYYWCRKELILICRRLAICRLKTTASHFIAKRLKKINRLLKQPS